MKSFFIWFIGVVIALVIGAMGVEGDLNLGLFKSLFMAMAGVLHVILNLFGEGTFLGAFCGFWAGYLLGETKGYKATK